jgi:tellurite resistance protein TehA-like permease
MRETVQHLDAGHFAFVMATGIVSVAALDAGVSAAARALLALNTGAYAVLAGMMAARCGWFPSGVADDLGDSRKAPQFFAIVAATSVLGVQYARIAGGDREGFWLLVAAGALWLVVVYTFFAGMVIRRDKRGLGQDVHGGWLLAAVATQSLAVLGTAIATPPAASERAIHFASLVLFLLGGVLYLFILGGTPGGGRHNATEE